MAMKSLATQPRESAALYTRASKDRDGKEISSSRQERIGRKTASTHQLDVVHVFNDNDLSASRFATRPRTGFIEMMSEARSPERRFDVIVIQHPDRLYREPKELEDIIDTVRTYGLRIVNADFGAFDLSNDDGIMVARMLGAAAAKEADSTSRRYRSMHEDIAQRGLPSGGGLRAFGYEADGLTLIESEAALVADAVSRVLAGATLRSLAQEWTRAGVRTTQGNAFTPTTLGRLLKGARIAGVREQYRKNPRTQKRELVGSYPAAWPAIVSPEEHARLRAVLCDPSRRLGGDGTSARKHLLSGLLRCARCDMGMSAGAGAKGNKRYSCNRPGGCQRCSVVTHAVDAAVRDALLAALDREALAARSKQRSKRTTKLVDPMADVRRLEAKLDELTADYYDDDNDMTPSEYQAARRRIMSKLDEAKRAVAKQRPERPSAKSIVGHELTSAADFDELPLHTKRALLSAHVERIMLTPGTRGVQALDLDERLDIIWRH